jgi:enoyl-CoA hydratase
VLLVRKDGPILRVTLNRPESRNPLSRDLVASLHSTFTHYAKDPDLKAAVVTGAGDKAFAAGGDLKELMAVKTAAQATEMSNTTRAAFQTIRDFPVPVIAAMNGDALGGGAEFAVACDIRVATQHCRMGFIQGRLNISTAWGGAHDLIQLVGPATALRLMSRSEMIDMQTGCRLGLIDDVAGDGERLDDVVARCCTPIIEMAPHVVRTFKALTREAKNAGRTESDRLETELFVANWVHDDHWTAAGKVFSRKG